MLIMCSFIWSHGNSVTVSVIGIYDYIYNQGSFSGLFQDAMIQKINILVSTLCKYIEVSKLYFFQIQLCKEVDIPEVQREEKGFYLILYP